MTRYAIGLGSNLGDRLANLRFAISRLTEVGEVGASSGLFETDPVGGPVQESFFNAVVLVEADLDPLGMIGVCHRLETEAGRVREARWGPRTLDVDILVWEEGSFSESGLEIPHPRAHERAFVLIPLVEVWPEAELASGQTAIEALDNVPHEGVALVAPDW